MKKILIIGSTGKLGIKLLNYSLKNNINIFGITGYKNINLLNKLKIKHKIKFAFNLSQKKDKDEFIHFLNSRYIDLIYFLDYGAGSLEYLNLFLNKNSNSDIAIANKEMIIVGGKLLIKKIELSKNNFIPLDSEHFSLINSNLDYKNIDKVYITASGGPFYFKNIKDLKKVNLTEVLNHPKWSMGINNSIDSSNFVNKLLEIHELSIIYNIDINKIDFLISKEAYIHSIVVFKDGKITLNCFDNDMLIPLTYPLRKFYNLPSINYKKNKLLNISNFKLEIFNDRRFIINKYIKKIKSFNHRKLIDFIILNNISHVLYLKNDIKYNDIIRFIFKKIDHHDMQKKLNSINNVLNYFYLMKKKYEKNI